MTVQGCKLSATWQNYFLPYGCFLYLCSLKNTSGIAKKQALQLFEEKKVHTVWDDEQLFRIIHSIPSPKAEPSKQWMAEH